VLVSSLYDLLALVNAVELTMYETPSTVNPLT
jgi:hypothetical protein